MAATATAEAAASASASESCRRAQELSACLSLSKKILQSSSSAESLWGICISDRLEPGAL